MILYQTKYIIEKPKYDYFKNSPEAEEFYNKMGWNVGSQDFKMEEK